jgi:hypothetical protein
MAAEDPYRHPGGRTCAGAMLTLVSLAAAAGGLLTGIFWAALH